MACHYLKDALMVGLRVSLMLKVAEKVEERGPC